MLQILLFDFWLYLHHVLVPAWFWPRKPTDTNIMFKFWYSQVPSVFQNSVRGMTKQKATSITLLPLGWVVLAGMKVGSLPIKARGHLTRSSSPSPHSRSWKAGLKPQIANFITGCCSLEESETATLKVGSSSVSKTDKVAIRNNFLIHLSVLYSVWIFFDHTHPQRHQDLN